jgi:hypothetical protein
MSCASISGWSTGGHRVLPDHDRLGHQRPQVARAGAHVAVGELEPGPREGVVQRLRIGQEAPRDLLVDGVHTQRHVGGGHHRRVALGRVVRVGHGAGRRPVFGAPLVRARGALGQLPLVAEQRLEVAVVPADGVGRPRALDAAGGGVRALAAAQRVLPAQALLLDPGALGLAAHQARIARAVRLAEGVTTRDQRHRLLVVHGHPREGLADVTGRRDGIGHAVGPLRVHVDEAHLHGAERVGELAVAGVALIAQPLGLGPPVDVLLGRPDVGATAAEAEGLEPHGVQRHVTREHQQVGPRELAAVLLLDGPQQATGLVEVAVVGPAVERREALRAGPCAAAAVGDTVRARGVPGHAHEERAVVTVVCRPPRLRVRHQRVQVLDHRVEVQLLEFFSVVEAGAHRVRLGGVLVQDAQAQLVGPPAGVGGRARHGVRGGVARERAFGFIGHGYLLELPDRGCP